MIDYRKMDVSQLTSGILSAFSRTQEVTECWRMTPDGWQLKPIAFREEWGDAEKAQVIDILRGTLQRGGYVLAARENGDVVGFVSVERALFGGQDQYCQLAMLHVSSPCRRMGVGKALLHQAMDAARGFGAKKLYISAHSSKESQAFYRAMGCVDALEPNEEAVRMEPCDCQLELAL